MFEKPKFMGRCALYYLILLVAEGVIMHRTHAPALVGYLVLAQCGYLALWVALLRPGLLVLRWLAELGVVHSLVLGVLLTNQPVALAFVGLLMAILAGAPIYLYLVRHYRPDFAAAWQRWILRAGLPPVRCPTEGGRFISLRQLPPGLHVILLDETGGLEPEFVGRPEDWRGLEDLQVYCERTSANSQTTLPVPCTWIAGRRLANALKTDLDTGAYKRLPSHVEATDIVGPWEPSFQVGFRAGFGLQKRRLMRRRWAEPTAVLCDGSRLLHALHAFDAWEKDLPTQLRAWLNRPAR